MEEQSLDRPASNGGDYVKLWTGRFTLSLDDAFFIEAARTGRTFVDNHARGKPTSEAAFSESLAALRHEAPTEGQVLLDELEHRWSYPDAPPALYLLTCEARAHDGFTFMAGDRTLGLSSPITKLGEAKRSLAGRLARYAAQMGMKRVAFTDGSLVLRVAIFGRGSRMIQEREVKEIAKRTGTVLHHMHETGLRSRIGNESFVGESIIEPICALAAQRATL